MTQHNQLKEALTALKHAYTAVDELITAEPIRFLKGRILSTLQREINQLATHISEPLLKSQLDAVNKPRPLRSFLGKPLAASAATTAAGSYAREQVPPPVKTMTPQEIAAAELQAAAEILYTQISAMDNEAVIDAYADMEIRAVAMMADLPVTEDNPKKINTAYIDKIKEAIAKKNAPQAPDNSPAQITEPNETHQKEINNPGNEPSAAKSDTEGTGDIAKASEPDAQPAAAAPAAPKTNQETTSKTSSNKGKGK